MIGIAVINSRSHRAVAAGRVDPSLGQQADSAGQDPVAPLPLRHNCRVDAGLRITELGRLRPASSSAPHNQAACGAPAGWADSDDTARSPPAATDIAVPSPSPERRCRTTGLAPYNTARRVSRGYDFHPPGHHSVAYIAMGR